MHFIIDRKRWSIESIEEKQEYNLEIEETRKSKKGDVNIRQHAAFAPIYLKKRAVKK